MTEQLHLYQSEADIDVTPLEIRSRLPDDAVEVESEDALEFTRLESNLLFDIRYNWRLISKEDSYRLIEQKHASVYFFGAFAIAGSSFLYSLTIADLISGAFILLNFGLMMTSASGLYSLSGYGAGESPIREIFDKGENRFYANHLITLLLGVVVSAPLSTIDSFYQVVCPLSFLFILRTYWRKQDVVVKRTTKWNRKIRDLIENVPKVVLAYFVGILAFMFIETVCLMIVHIYDFSAVFRRSPILFSIILVSILSSLIISAKSGINETHNIVSTQLYLGKELVTPSSNLVINALVVVLWSIIFALYSGFLLLSGWNFTVEVGWMGVYAVVLIASAPFFYCLLGAIYQFFNFLYANVVIAVKSEPEDLGLVRDVPVRVVESGVCTAGAVHLGKTKFVVVSQGLREKLDDNELEAVVAHEEAHFHYGDAWLAFVTGLLASLVFTGRNVLFSVLDFRSREFRADQYAVEEVGEDALIDALNKLQEVEYRENPRGVAGLAPTVTNFNSSTGKNLLESIFGFYYGSFALSGVHPSPQERKSAVRQLSRSK